MGINATEIGRREHVGCQGRVVLRDLELAKHPDDELAQLLDRVALHAARGSASARATALQHVLQVRVQTNSSMAYPYGLSS